MGHWNLNGSMSKQFGSKLELDEVLKIIERCHIFGITETHLLPSNGKQLAGYKDFHSFRKNGKRKKDKTDFVLCLRNLECLRFS